MRKGEILMAEKNPISRRRFLAAAASAEAVMLVPRSVLGGAGGVSPNDKLQLGCIGVGAQGTRVMMDFLKRPDVQVVSVCDVNQESDDYSEWGENELRNKAVELVGSGFHYPNSGSRGGVAGREPARRIVEGVYAKEKTSGAYKGCTAYQDFREMLESEKNLDAVAVCTPDHAHAVISISAMKKGKHVYCQKAMCRTLHEARRMAETTQDTKTATQVAVGNHASEATRLLCEWIWDGAIGAVREVHNWSSRPLWPQGHDRPEKGEPVPPGLDWNLWVGPSPERPYHSVYLPFIWRGWRDFGTGALGDMGCYSFDTIFRVLKLTSPVCVEASPNHEYRVERGVSKMKKHPETYPHASIVRFHFPARESMPPVTLHWYDGGILPSRPEELGDAQPFENEGMLFVGDKGKILCQFTGSDPKLIPEAKMKAYKQPPKTLPRSVGHYQEWIDACKGGSSAGADFTFTARVTETLLLGNLALCADKSFLRWEGATMKSPDLPDADAYVNPPYRSGWSL